MERDINLDKSDTRKVEIDIKDVNNHKTISQNKMSRFQWRLKIGRFIIKIFMTILIFCILVSHLMKLYVSNHRTTEWQGLEETSGDHLVEPPQVSAVHWIYVEEGVAEKKCYELITTSIPRPPPPLWERR